MFKGVGIIRSDRRKYVPWGSLFYTSEEVRYSLFCITCSKGGRFYYSLPLLGGGQEGVLKKSKETPPSSSPKRGGELGTFRIILLYIYKSVHNTHVITFKHYQMIQVKKLMPKQLFSGTFLQKECLNR